MSTGEAQTVEQRSRYGKSLRKSLPRSRHAQWSPARERPDPIDLLMEQNQHRIDWLVPIRHGRMSASPFAFFRGSARIMAADLAATPVTGLNVQLCGDAHLANFGLFGTPERQLVFDINDFDETLAGPWEWDIKRLATSFTLAARHNRLGKRDTQRVTRGVVRSYREAMIKFAAMRNTDIWYAMLGARDFIQAAHTAGREAQARAITDSAYTKDSRQALDKLAEEKNGEYRIKSEPPELIPLRELKDRTRLKDGDLRTITDNAFLAYQQSVPAHCRHLLDRFRPIDVAMKVVGVGSVGTLCLILLLEGRDRQDPLFLQLKEANPSVLEAYLPPSPYTNQGQRVVEGQRLIQTVSDIFLGWTEGTQTRRHFYWRQLRDWKGSADVEDMSKQDLGYHARLCGWTLARAHARSGDALAIAGYLGSGGNFDEALLAFSTAYADQNEKDYERFMDRIRGARIEAVPG